MLFLFYKATPEFRIPVCPVSISSSFGFCLILFPFPSPSVTFRKVSRNLVGTHSKTSDKMHNNRSSPEQLCNTTANISIKFSAIMLR
jgi:hypothetical protein